MKRFVLLIVALFCASAFAQEGIDGTFVPPAPAPIGSAPVPALVPAAPPVADGAQQEAVLPATLTEDGVLPNAEPQQVVDEPLEPPTEEPLVEQAPPPPMEQPPVEAAQQAAQQAAPGKKRAKDLPPIAVYVTGNVPDEDKKALGTYMLASLAKSGRYIAVERSNDFLAAVEAEHIKQRSGDVDDSQISKLGKQFGVKYVCVADITKAFNGNDFQISARIIDVETAVVVYIGEAYGKVKSMAGLTRISNNVVDNMFDNESDSKPRRLHNRISIAFEPRIGGSSITRYSKLPGLHRGDGVSLTQNIYFDFIYAEIIGRTASTQPLGSEAKEFELYSIISNAHILAKYPIDMGIIKVFPLLGCSPASHTLIWRDTAFDYGAGYNDIQFTLGGRVDAGLSKSAYASAEYLHGFGGVSNSQSLKINSGLDLGIGKKKRWFWRPELAYVFRRTVFTETDTYAYKNRKAGAVKTEEKVKEKTEISVHDFAVHVGIGYKWKGKKQRL